MPGCARCPQPTTECGGTFAAGGETILHAGKPSPAISAEFNLGFPGTFQTTGKPESSAARCVRLLRAAWLVALPDLWLGDHAGAHQR